ncbi:MAG: hypothetical protein R2699_06540 [Acidimicrobiales bacterium]
MEPAAPTSTTWQRIVRVVEPHQGGRFAALDGYRAVAAIGVLVYHVASNAKLTQGTGSAQRLPGQPGQLRGGRVLLALGFLLYRGFVFSALTDGPAHGGSGSGATASCGSTRPTGWPCWPSSP